MSLYSKENPNQQIKDPVLNKYMLIGYCDRGAYKIEPHKKWFDKWYDKQEPETYILDKLNIEQLKRLEISIFAASWCGACRVETARFYKIFDLLKIPFDNVSVLYLNKQKTVPGVDISRFNITRVPTFIFNHEGKELGRITEQPKDTLEADILEIQQNSTNT